MAYQKLKHQSIEPVKKLLKSHVQEEFKRFIASLTDNFSKIDKALIVNTSALDMSKDEIK